MNPRNRFARARSRPKPGTMNKTESAYADHLSSRKLAGEIVSHQFEAIKLRLADKTFYTPDFVVVMADLSIELHEVKGHWEEDARVKIKVAAETFPYLKFVAVKKLSKKLGGGWDREDFR